MLRRLRSYSSTPIATDNVTSECSVRWLDHSTSNLHWLVLPAGDLKTREFFLLQRIECSHISKLDFKNEGMLWVTEAFLNTLCAYILQWLKRPRI